MADFAILSAEIDMLASGQIYFPSEDHRIGAKTTRYPVESGKELSDNLVRDQDRIRLEGIVSDVEPGVTRGDPTVVWQRLKGLSGSTLVTVVTQIRTYRNMAIIEAQTRRDRRTGRALSVVIELEEVLFAVSSEIALTPAAVSGPAGGRTAHPAFGGTRPSPGVPAARFPAAPTEASLFAHQAQLNLRRVGFGGGANAR